MSKQRLVPKWITFSLIAEDGSTLVHDAMLEVDDVSVKPALTTEQHMPSGQTNETGQITGWAWTLVIKGGQVGKGFLTVVDAQITAAKAGKAIPKVRLSRIFTPPAGADWTGWTETYTGGTVQDAESHQATNDKTLDESITIRFEDRSIA